MDLGIVLSNETTPFLLMKKIEEVETANGKYKTEDANDHITSIQIRYDGEIIEFIFNKNTVVSFDNKKEIPVNKDLLYFVQLEEGASMRASVKSTENTTLLELRSEDSQWKWVLSMEIRYYIR